MCCIRIYLTTYTVTLILMEVIYSAHHLYYKLHIYFKTVPRVTWQACTHITGYVYRNTYGHFSFTEHYWYVHTYTHHELQ